MPGSVRKAQIRNRIWEQMTRSGIALFPGAYGQTPAFRGQADAMAKLRSLDAWVQANRVLVLGEPALQEVREAAVADGKVLLVADLSYGAAGWILEIDPTVLGPEQSLVAARMAGSGPLGRPCKGRCLRGKETAPVDLMVIGAVGVDRRGNRVGKGLGGSDLVYALGRDRGFLEARTPVAVLIHRQQIFDEPTDREPTDLPIDYIVTPDEVARVRTVVMRPKGLHPCMITPRRLEAFPGLRLILEREGISVPEKRVGRGFRG